jgi:chitodextrinase
MTVRLTWTTPIVGTYPLATYSIERSTNGVDYAELVSRSIELERTYDDESATEGEYSYRVRARDTQDNWGAYSNVVSFEV